MTSPLMSSARQTWQTPHEVLDLVRAVAPIALDPATAPSNPTGARSFYAPYDPRVDDYEGRHAGPCGLAGSWARSGLGFINPPYGPRLGGPVEPDYEHTKRCAECRGAGAAGREGPGSTRWVCGACSGSGRVTTGKGRGWAARIAKDPGPWIALVPSRTETAWWRDLFRACDLALLWSSPTLGARIRFIDADTGKRASSAPFPSTVFFREGSAPLLRARFRDAFGPHGELVRRA